MVRRQNCGQFTAKQARAPNGIELDHRPPATCDRSNVKHKCRRQFNPTVSQKALAEGKHRLGFWAKRVIPCADVDRGRVVKGTKFVEFRDAGDSAQLATRYEAEGADELVFLDITASHEGRAIMLEASLLVGKARGG